MSPADEVRPEVVTALFRSPDPELLFNVTQAERRAAADMHYEAHLRLMTRLDAYRYATIKLTHEWQRTHHINMPTSLLARR